MVVVGMEDYIIYNNSLWRKFLIEQYNRSLYSRLQFHFKDVIFPSGADVSISHVEGTSNFDPESLTKMIQGEFCRSCKSQLTGNEFINNI